MRACKTSFFLLLLCATLKGQSLRQGHKAPDIKVFSWIKGGPVTGFKKGQVYLIEMGATWCIPCGRAVPHLSSLAKQYGSRLVVASVFVLEAGMGQDRGYIQRVEKYIRKQGDAMDYHAGVDSPDSAVFKAWVAAAGKYSVPWAFLIDKEGRVAWIGNPAPGLLDSAVARVESPSYSPESERVMAVKESLLKKPVVNMQAPLFVDGNGGAGKMILYRSLLTQYDGEAGSGAGAGINYVATAKQSGNRPGQLPYAQMVQQMGAPLGLLYYMAYADTCYYWVPSRMMDTDEYPDTIRYPALKSSYGNFWYQPVLEIKDTSAFSFRFPLSANRYNYSLILNDSSCTSASLQRIMQKDLEICFGYKVTVETRMMPCWNLVAKPGAAQALATKTPGRKFRTEQSGDTLYLHHNAVMKDVLIRLIQAFSFGNIRYGIQPRETAPFTDATGIRGDIDYSISDREFDEMRKHNWGVSLEFLHRLGLDLVKGVRPTKVVVIREPGN